MTNTEETTVMLLCQAIEKVSGITLHTPSDYERLSSVIFDQQHITVSSSTLKRLWGYAGQEAHPRAFTLMCWLVLLATRTMVPLQNPWGVASNNRANCFLPIRSQQTVWLLATVFN